MPSLSPNKTEKNQKIHLYKFSCPKSTKVKQEVQMQLTQSFKSQRVGYQSNQKLLHHYQHSRNQLNPEIHS